MNNKHKILYVDDELINRKIFEIVFAHKYEILIASDGYEGLKVLNENPDVLIVISDMSMPGLNGIEFIEKAKEAYPLKKYYMLSGFQTTPEIEAKIEDGLILKYFEKPLNKTEIETEIEKYN